MLAHTPEAAAQVHQAGSQAHDLPASHGKQRFVTDLDDGVVQRLRSLGVGLDAQMAQHSNQLVLALQNMMRTQFRRSFTDRFVGVASVRVKSANRLRCPPSSSVHVVVAVEGRSARTVGVGGGERVHWPAGSATQFPVTSRTAALTLSVLATNPHGATTVLGEHVVRLGRAMDEAQATDQWLTIHAPRDGADGEEKETGVVCCDVVFLPAEDFNVCDSRVFKAKVEDCFSGCLERMRGVAANAQRHADDQRQLIASQQQRNEVVEKEVEVLKAKHKEALESEAVEADAFVQQLGAVVRQHLTPKFPETYHMHAHVMGVTFEGAVALPDDIKGLVISMAFASHATSTTTCKDFVTPSWDEDLVLPVPRAKQLEDSVPLVLTLHAVPKKPGPWRVVGRNVFVGAQYMSALESKLTIKARLFEAVDANSHSDALLGHLVMTMQLQPLARPLDTPEAFDWNSRGGIRVAMGNMRSDLVLDYNDRLAVLATKRFAHKQLVSAVERMAHLDSDVPAAALWDMVSHVRGMTQQDVDCLCRVGAVRDACQASLEHVCTVLSEMVTSVSAFVTPLQASVAPLLLPHQLNAIVEDHVIRPDNGPDDLPSKLVWPTLKTEAAKMSEAVAFMHHCKLGSDNAVAMRERLHQTLLPTQGRVHIHVMSVSNVPVSQLKVSFTSSMFVVVELNNKTFATAPVAVGDQREINAHLVFDVFDVATAMMRVKLCVRDSEANDDSALLVGECHVPMHKLSAEVPSVMGSHELVQQGKAYVSCGSLKLNMMFAQSQAEPAQGDYAAQASSMHALYTNKIHSLEEAVARANDHRKAAAEMAKQLKAKLREEMGTKQKQEEELVALRAQLQQLQQAKQAQEQSKAEEEAGRL